MRRFLHLAMAASLLVIIGVGGIGATSSRAQSAESKAKGEAKRPQLILKVTPVSGMAPIRISGSAELKGGDDDFEEYYCPTIEWNWGDGTVSESSDDCEPYEAGKSMIRRRYTVSHPYKQGGHYRISFRLKRKDKVVGQATTVVQLLGGGPF